MVRYRLWIAVVAAAAFIAALPAAALAGGWSTVTADPLAGDMVAGQEFTVGFTVLQHGVTPMDNLQPIVKLTDPTGAFSQTVKAAGEGGPGHYVASIVLDQPGSWQWVVEAFEGDHQMPPLMVSPAAAKPASAGPSGELSVSAVPLSWPALAIPLLLVVSAIAMAAMGSRSRWHSRSGHVG